MKYLKTFNESIDNPDGFQQYKNRINELITDILPNNEKDIKYSNWDEIYDGIISINSSVNVKDWEKFSGYNVDFSINVTDGGRGTQIINIPLNNNTKPDSVWKSHNASIFIDQDAADKLARIVRKLSNYADISDRTIDSIVDSIYTKLVKK